MEPVDVLSAASDGFFALLDAAIGADDVEVTTNPKPLAPGDTTERRYVIIGDIDADEQGGKGEQLEIVSVQIQVVYRGTQRSKLHALMHQVRLVLDGAMPVVAGVDFGSIAYLAAASSPAARDGITHAGVVEFEVQAEPA